MEEVGNDRDGHRKKVRKEAIIEKARNERKGGISEGKM